MAVVILLIFITCALILYRKRKGTLIVSGTATGTPSTNRSKSEEMKQMQTEQQRHHLKKQNTDIEDIVKLQAAKKTRRPK